ncbi:MAG: DUF503 domain-containing protein [Jiangellales bacterium]
MWTGTLQCDLLLGDVRSLKQKRAVVRPLVAELRRRFDVASAETGHLDLLRRAEVGVALVAVDPAHCTDVLDAVERFVAERVETDLLDTRRALHGPHDD